MSDRAAFEAWYVEERRQLENRLATERAKRIAAEQAESEAAAALKELDVGHRVHERFLESVAASPSVNGRRADLGSPPALALTEDPGRVSTLVATVPAVGLNGDGPGGSQAGPEAPKQTDQAASLGVSEVVGGPNGGKPPTVAARIAQLMLRDPQRGWSYADAATVLFGRGDRDYWEKTRTPMSRMQRRGQICRKGPEPVFWPTDKIEEALDS